VICVLTPEPFWGVGSWYEDFSPTSDDEVRELLRNAEVQAASPAFADAEVGPGSPPFEGVALAENDSWTELARPLRTGEDRFDPVLELIGDARIVLLGEASHGTHEFYRERAVITERLLTEKGFDAVAVEADWPDALEVHRYVRRGKGSRAGTAEAALSGFRRFPAWMWRNADVVAFVRWLRRHNDSVAPGDRAGFFGLDLYGLHAAAQTVIAYLDGVDPEAAARARDRYSCFDHFRDDPAQYARATYFGMTESCEHEVLAQLRELRDRADHETREGTTADDELFLMTESARAVHNAEEYYRTMFSGRVQSWNLRDRHMTETLVALDTHLSRRLARPAKLVVWAHNSHLGDARATEMGRLGELNVGQLVREHYDRAAVLIGFTTYSGYVTAASSWGAPVEIMRVRPALPDSYEALFHHLGGDFFLPLGEPTPEIGPRLERAIGVIYRPDLERQSHYFEAALPQQFDAIIHLDDTNAVAPLERISPEPHDEPPETFPSAL
jgi:erythromycin esterase-like protein